MPQISEKLKLINQDLHRLELEKFQLELEFYYEQLRQQGVDEICIDCYRQEDLNTLEEALNFKRSFMDLRSTFFGYPGNLTEDSPLVKRLRQEEASLVYINNAGDPFEQSYGNLDGKVYERKVLDLFFKRYQMNPDASWGYISQGGSESNVWAILNGFRHFPQGHLYFCESAHYSVEKAVLNGTQALYPYTKIPTQSNQTDAIHVEKLLDKIKTNYHQTKAEPILLLTWGSTKFGSVDEVAMIVASLKAESIPYYLHVDAAFYGGLPRHQVQAPVISSLEDLGAHSISISFHKFLGIPQINSVVLSKDKASGLSISYLHQHDTTVSGSRSFAIFSAYQRIREVFERSPENFYHQPIQHFEACLKKNPILYHRDHLSNIIVIPKPSDDVCHRYQLATFEGKSGQITLAHFILNPFHSFEEIHQLVSDVYQDQITNDLTLDL